MPFVPFSRAKGGAQPGGGTMQQMPALQSMQVSMPNDNDNYHNDDVSHNHIRNHEHEHIQKHNHDRN